MKLWKYKNYDEYVKVQTEGNLNKLKNVWARHCLLYTSDAADE